jgi:hypothetical protein
MPQINMNERAGHYEHQTDSPNRMGKIVELTNTSHFQVYTENQEWSH